MKTVAELLDAKPKELFTVEPNLSVAQALDSMREHHIHSLLVVENRQLIGIVTDRDFQRKVASKGLDPAAMNVDQIMTRSVVTITPQGTVDDCLHLMTDHTIHHLPVCADGELVGMVSWSDIMALMFQD
jgi:CBS domain-containing protein